MAGVCAGHGRARARSPHPRGA